MTEPPSGTIQARFWDTTDPTLLAGVGRVSIKWSFLEAVVEDCIAGFIGANVELVYTLTANISITTRLNAIQAVAQLRLTDDDFEYFVGIIQGIQKLVPFRNKVIHGLWAETNQIGIAQVVAIKSSHRLKQQLEYVNALYLDWLANEIMRTSTSLMQFAQDFGVIVPPSKPSLSSANSGS